MADFKTDRLFEKTLLQDYVFNVKINVVVKEQTGEGRTPKTLESPQRSDERQLGKSAILLGSTSVSGKSLTFRDFKRRTVHDNSSSISCESVSIESKNDKSTYFCVW